VTKTKTLATKPVVVTTAHRGVFYGLVPDDQSLDVTSVRLELARMCIYWSEDVKGILGLAAMGPSKTCRVGPVVPAITLQNVTAIMEASKEAAKAWTTIVWN